MASLVELIQSLGVNSNVSTQKCKKVCLRARARFSQVPAMKSGLKDSKILFVFSFVSVEADKTTQFHSETK